MLTESEVHRLLNDLCVRLGFCLPPNKWRTLEQNPPNDVRLFTDAVFLAEGLDPATADRRLYRQVRDLVAAAFERSGCRTHGA
ncbi:hypothetical protein [Polyangium jinanense]|uniref:Uncharacterized protein n=1 Tax=Polyangium jinanense TaxID=2829994 RepID=A0A9X3XCA9_9BACT|nr:hypothetical protein [Polyangium jinanense]MDC3959796.1 hypothetical protein [Polyangium jinanense]MDC3988059.1 hypothetical protein [Polyangium jinanense]